MYTINVCGNKQIFFVSKWKKKNVHLIYYKRWQYAVVLQSKALLKSSPFADKWESYFHSMK